MILSNHVVYIIRNLERNITVIHTLLNRINNTFSKDSSDCLSTLSSVLELLRLMMTIDNSEEMAVTRTKVISREELRQFLLWSPDVRHPLDELEVRVVITVAIGRGLDISVVIARGYFTGEMWRLMM